MTNNPNFTYPHPPLADVAATLTTLDDAYKAHQIAKADARTKASVADDAEIQFDSHLRKLAAYVESIADKDETVIASAGMQTKTSRTTPSALTAPEALSATAGDHESEINLTWRKVENARSVHHPIEPGSHQVLRVGAMLKPPRVSPRQGLRRSLIFATAFALFLSSLRLDLDVATAVCDVNE